MKIFHIALRVGLGLILLAFGFNKFFWFMPDFDFSGYPEAKHLFKAIRYSWSEDVGKSYLMHLVGLVEITVGILLVIKKWVPFALILLGPISVNIVLFHAFLNLPNIAPAILVGVVNTYLIYVNRDAYKSIFR
ncbi:DoxX family membrane protein [Winogradskyella ursingii]|uniref:DoxX family membrane protein n=1 Tax=Winogradskyella ursingii TaxID=2686079 RepID=UPI0015C84B8B|nr:DoxX family membrane protein [Winogradskyella ursingii]